MHDAWHLSLLLALLATVIVAVQTWRLNRQRSIAVAHRAASAREEARSVAANARRLRAADGEDAAFHLLERAGYKVVERQAPGSWTVRANGEALTFGLRADYIVANDGRRYIAEVKTGRLAPRLSHGPTRRQLLEYSAAFDANGVILVDADAQTLTHVEVSLPARTAAGGGAAARTMAVVSVLSFSIGLLVAAAILK